MRLDANTFLISSGKKFIGGRSLSTINDEPTDLEVVRR
jgi:hypothetical protein